MIPKVSIVVPIYNVENYLDKCIQSLINQTLEEIEIILINDGSTDRSGEIANCYANKDGRIKVLHKENGGQCSARNEGVKLATGAYIGFLDSDDWAEVNMYEELYYAAFNEDADLAVCSRKVFDEDNNFKTSINVENNILKNVNKYRYKYFVEYLIGTHRLGVCNKIYKCELIKKYNNIFFKDINKVGSEDTLFNYELLKDIGKIVSTSKTWFNQLSRNGSTMKSYKEGYFVRLNGLLEEMIAYEGNAISKEVMLFYIYFLNSYSNIILNLDEKGRGLLKKEYKMMKNCKFISKANKKLFFSNGDILNDLNYRAKGKFIIRIKLMLLFFRLYNISSILEGFLNKRGK